MRLGQHHVQCPSKCRLCENFIEDDLHVLFEYDVTTQCWRTSGLLHIIEPRLHYFDDVKSLILEICSHEDKKTTRRVTFMLDVI